MKSEEQAPIVEIFQSIQGEGKNIGVPSVFVRFFGCTLRCKFKGQSCDTPYVVRDDKSVLMSIKDVAGMITYFPATNIVFTGGEPTLYQPFIANLINYLRELKGRYHYTFEMETNGTIPIKSDICWLVNQFNVSVKLESSNQDVGFDSKRINDRALKSFPMGKTYFKFVVSSKYDMQEILDLHKKYSKFPVYLMPQGTTREEILENSEQVVQLALVNNFMFTTRLHILIWDRKRGV
jgi:organic radical activating enzyme